MSREGIEAFRARVHQEPELARQLHAVEASRFTDEAVRIAGELGCAVTASDVEDAVARGRGDWTLRWTR
jgi:predicted ribosomally synthesized peptide with nif11-like leader